MPSDPLAEFDQEILSFLQTAGVPSDIVQLSTPGDRQFGERSTNAAFRLARERRRKPLDLANEIVATFDSTTYRFLGAAEPAGAGFINFRLRYESFLPAVVAAVQDSPALFGRRPTAGTEHVVVEHTSVNPNKEWHIGHARNAVLGDVVSRLLRLAGAEVEVQNYVDDTGLQAAQAIFGLQAFPEEPRPNEKYDHFVGRAYVKVAGELGAERDLRRQLDALEAVEPAHRDDRWHLEQESLGIRLANLKRLQAGVIAAMHSLEQGEYHGSVEQILNAQLLTAYRLGIFYNLLNWESHLVRSRLFQQAIDLLQRSDRVYRPAAGHYAGALTIDTAPPAGEGEEPKREVLIRTNGIPTYVAKDIAYHIWKFGLVPDRLSYREYSVQPDGGTLWSTSLDGGQRGRPSPERVINVIAVDQSLAQEAVKEGLRAGNFPEAANRLVHLSYGLVRKAEGKLSGRQGTAASADDVIDEAVRVALERVREKRSQDLTDEEMERIAEAVGVGAVRYFMVQYNPMRDIIFDVSDVVSYDGNTGLYVQYALVRMYAILRRASAEHQLEPAELDGADLGLLQHEQEHRLIFHLAGYPELVAVASRTLSVNLVAEWAYDLATIFNQFYRDCGVLNADPALRAARVLLVATVRDALVNACTVLGLPVIERL